jgi:hypothetical protein
MSPYERVMPTPAVQLARLAHEAWATSVHAFTADELVDEGVTCPQAAAANASESASAIRPAFVIA